MKKVLIGLLVLVALIVVGVLVAPNFVDWNRYKDRIAARLQAELGREVAIAGDLSLSLLPAPALAAEGLSIAGPRGGDVVTVESLRLRLAPSALLQGRLQVASLVLVEPVLVLPGSEAFAPRTEGPAPEGTPVHGGRFAVDFDRVVIEDGTVVYGRAGEGVQRLQDLDLTLHGSLNGPLEFSGQATWRDLRFVAEGETGRFGGSGATPLAVTLAVPQADARATFEGRWSGGQGTPALAGRLEAVGTDLAALAAAFGAEAPPALARRFRVQGQMRGEGDRIALDDASLLVGQTEASGAISAVVDEVPRLDVALSFRTIDLDAGLAAGLGPADPGEAVAVGEGEPSDPPFTLPSRFAANVDVNADAVVWRGAVLRQGVLQASLVDGVLTVERLGAFGPGGSDLAASGRLRAVEGMPAFDAQFETAVDNLRAVLDWLDVKVPDLPPDRLRKFAAKGTVQGTPSSFQVPDLEVWLDTTHLRGAANVQVGRRLAVGANITLDNLNLDAYRPQDTGAPGNAATGPGGDSAVIGAWEILAALDANVRARMERLTVNGHTLRDLLVDGTLLQGDITFREARVGEVDGAGALALEGTVRGLAEGAPAFEAFTFTLQTEDPAEALRLLGAEPPAAFADLAPATVAGTLDGPLGELRIASNNTFGAGSLTLAGHVAGLPAAPSYALEVEAAHPSTAELLSLLLPDYQPAGRPGPFALKARLEGDGEAVTVSGLSLAAGETRLAGEGTVTLAERPKVVATLQGQNLVLDPLLPTRTASRLRPPPGVLPAAVGAGAPPPGSPWSEEPLPLDWLAAFDAELDLSADLLAMDDWHLRDPVARVVVAQGMAEVERLKASLFGGGLTVVGHLAAEGTAAARLTLTNAAIDEALGLVAGIDVVSGRLSAEAEFATRGESSYAMSRNLAGSGQVAVMEGVLDGIDLVAVSRQLRQLDSVAGLLGVVRAGLFGGSTAFHELRGSFTASEGVVETDDLRLTSDAGAGAMVAEINLPAFTLDARGTFALAEFPEAPPLVLRLEGPLDDPRRSLDVEQLQAYLLARGFSRLLTPREEEPAGEAEAQVPAEEPPDETRRENFQPEDLMRGLLEMLEQRQQQRQQVP